MQHLQLPLMKRMPKMKTPNSVHSHCEFSDFMAFLASFSFMLLQVRPCKLYSVSWFSLSALQFTRSYVGFYNVHSLRERKHINAICTLHSWYSKMFNTHTYLQIWYFVRKIVRFLYACVYWRIPGGFYLILMLFCNF